MSNVIARVTDSCDITYSTGLPCPDVDTTSPPYSPTVLDVGYWSVVRARSRAGTAGRTSPQPGSDTVLDTSRRAVGSLAVPGQSLVFGLVPEGQVAPASAK